MILLQFADVSGKLKIAHTLGNKICTDIQGCFSREVLRLLREVAELVCL